MKKSCAPGEESGEKCPEYVINNEYSQKSTRDSHGAWGIFVSISRLQVP